MSGCLFQVSNLGFQQRWVSEHISDAYGLGKPFVIEEFGKIAYDDDYSRSSVRDPHFRHIYDTFSSQRGSGGPMKGKHLYIKNCTALTIVIHVSLTSAT